MPSLGTSWARHRVDLDDLDGLLEIFAEGNGLLVTSGHAGHWELMGHLGALLGLPVHAIARPLRDGDLEQLVRKIRESRGLRVFEKWNVLWSLKKLLDRGALVGINADQDTTVNRVFVPFGTETAATSATLAQLHRVTGAPIVVLTVNRLPGDLTYRVHLWRVVRHPKTDDAEADVRAIMTEVNAGLVEAIKEYPEQWLWTHRRWKTRPPESVIS